MHYIQQLRSHLQLHIKLSITINIHTSKINITIKNCMLANRSRQIVLGNIWENIWRLEQLFPILATLSNFWLSEQLLSNFVLICLIRITKINMWLKFWKGNIYFCKTLMLSIVAGYGCWEDIISPPRPQLFSVQYHCLVAQVFLAWLHHKSI